MPLPLLPSSPSPRRYACLQRLEDAAIAESEAATPSTLNGATPSRDLLEQVLPPPTHPFRCFLTSLKVLIPLPRDLLEQLGSVPGTGAWAAKAAAGGAGGAGGPGAAGRRPSRAGLKGPRSLLAPLASEADAGGRGSFGGGGDAARGLPQLKQRWSAPLTTGESADGLPQPRRSGSFGGSKVLRMCRSPRASFSKAGVSGA